MMFSGRRLAFGAALLAAAISFTAASAGATDPAPPTVWRLSGTRLKLHSVTGNDLQVNSADKQLKNFSADPRVSGVSVEITIEGRDHTYTLPASAWLANKKATNFIYVDPTNAQSPINRMLVNKARGTLQIAGTHGGFDFSLASSPGEVDVRITVADQQYCMAFPGPGRLLANVNYLVKDAPAPATC